MRQRHLTPHETVTSNDIKRLPPCGTSALFTFPSALLSSLHFEGWKYGASFLVNLASWVPVRLCWCKTFVGSWKSEGVEATLLLVLELWTTESDLQISAAFMFLGAAPMETILCGLVVISFCTSWHLKKSFESTSYFPLAKENQGNMLHHLMVSQLGRENTDIFCSCITSPWPTSDFSTRRWTAPHQLIVFWKLCATWGTPRGWCQSRVRWTKGL